MTAAPATARSRARLALTDEIKAAARRQLTEVGGPGLSVRAVARELGMASSAVYRYFPSRDSLLTALIVDSFDALGAAAEHALPAKGGVMGRWLAIAMAIRRWAFTNPHDYALIYGSPVPGYEAPGDTIGPAMRVSLVGLRIVADGLAAGEISTTPTVAVPRAVHADLARLRDSVAPDVPDEVLGRTLLVWTTLFGTISYEMFGHFQGAIDDGDAFFAHQMRRAGAYLTGS